MRMGGLSSLGDYEQPIAAAKAAVEAMLTAEYKASDMASDLKADTSKVNPTSAAQLDVLVNAFKTALGSAQVKIDTASVKTAVESGVAKAAEKVSAKKSEAETLKVLKSMDKKLNKK